MIVLFQKLGYSIVKSTKFQGLVCKLPKLNKTQLYRTKKTVSRKLEFGHFKWLFLELVH